MDGAGPTGKCTSGHGNYASSCFSTYTKRTLPNKHEYCSKMVVGNSGNPTNWCDQYYNSCESIAFDSVMNNMKSGRIVNPTEEFNLVFDYASSSENIENCITTTM